MLAVVCWRWGALFGREYVQRMYAGMQRHLHLPHTFYCVTDDPRPYDEPIVVVPMDRTFAETPRCRRRMVQYSKAFADIVGPRMLSIDLDMVIVGDMTPLVNRAEPIVMWKVTHAGVYSGSFVLCDTGALDGAWQLFRRDPEGFPRLASPRGVGSDQAMLNLYLKTQPPIAEWTDRDGIVTYYGVGYERYEHLGVGPNRTQLPKGARLVVLGSADKVVMDEGRYGWIRDHWIGNGVAA